MSRGFLTLLSDFGDCDVYVGMMKGAIARVAPQVGVVDLTHRIPAQDVAAGRFALASAVSFFPIGTVHVAVVDPGVGTARRGIAVQFDGGFLVGPDNGLLSGVLTERAAIAAVELTEPHYWGTDMPSATFHGRDIFAPVGAHLATGVPLKALGPAIAVSELVALPVAAVERMRAGWRGCIQYVDGFGNLVSNVSAAAVSDRAWSLILPSGTVVPGCRSYSDRAPGGVVALVGSHGWVEVAVNCGSAKEHLQLEVGDCVEVRFSTG
ncbi:hypothetical protein KR51_00034860 [Rubidibacter lacunae KORDI 51-2]|uniref:SAM-dependent chlorinase/fluorinase n=1 Tax=Rubidibacter lacunae KORDI 51-2 TaxID=582515 RepID=U5DJZ1_9CHRO|nr:SAM-dependent chlorinase/fluorinase [Rubidibacter lacunae]ERN40000.1 hypothetical protein KR51_00034860 [Rubidibacter lacunae KORDI 51-2]